jgi:hypothetical protein
MPATILKPTSKTSVSLNWGWVKMPGATLYIGSQNLKQMRKTSFSANRL